jgi:hypothetical protein
MTSKDLFLQDEAATKWLISVVHSPTFDKAVLHATQSWIEDSNGMNDVQINAVRGFLTALRDLPIEEPKAASFPSPKITHDVDNLERKIKAPSIKRKK